MPETVNQGNNGNGEAGAQGGGAAPQTFTQEQVNQMIADRVKREQAKYADYETLKAKAGKYDEAQNASKTEIEKLTEKLGSLETQLAASKKAEELHTIREKVAKETGVPAELLNSDTEEGCKEIANAIKQYAKASGYPNVHDGGEPGGVPKTSTAQQFAEWFGKI